MNLLSLKLKNFKGIKEFSLVTDGKNVDVYGDNATGKTTLFDAFCWLLFDKDSQGKKDFEIKTLDAAGKVIHALEHEVEGTLGLGGKQVTLRKVYAEKWTKKRGNATAEFTGHETNYFINGVPVKKNEFVAAVSDIAKEDAFRLLTSPAFFNEYMPATTGQPAWKKRRDILLQVCGDVLDEEVIAADKTLEKLPEILQDRKLEDHRKVIAAKRSELNKELEKIPTRIDEVQLGLPDISGFDVVSINTNRLQLKDILKQKRDNLLQLESGGEVAQKKVELSNIDADMLKLKNEHRAKVDNVLSDKRKSLEVLKSQIHTLNRQIADLTTDIITNDRRVTSYKAKAEELRLKWNNISSQQLEIDLDTICPACGQDLPEENLSEARSKAESNFNLEKSKNLTEISSQGKALMSDAVELEKKNSKLQEQITSLNAQLDGVEKEAAKLTQEIEANQSSFSDPDYEKKIVALERKKQNLIQDIELLKDGNSQAIEKARHEIADIDTQISDLEGSLAKINQHEAGQVRITKLKDQEKVLAAEYAKLEEELYLTEQFIRTKVSMLEEKINSKFKFARFKLFDTQINGGVLECCETLYKGVPYSGGLNNAARINVGLDIINTLSEYYGFDAPIFIDNSESVTKVADVSAQVIRLVVSEVDKKLRVEVSNNE